MWAGENGTYADGASERQLQSRPIRQQAGAHDLRVSPRRSCPAAPRRAGSIGQHSRQRKRTLGAVLRTDLGDWIAVTEFCYGHEPAVEGVRTLVGIARIDAYAATFDVEPGFAGLHETQRRNSDSSRRSRVELGIVSFARASLLLRVRAPGIHAEYLRVASI